MNEPSLHLTANHRYRSIKPLPSASPHQNPRLLYPKAQPALSPILGRNLHSALSGGWLGTRSTRMRVYILLHPP
jgi:hypothetical protein